MENTIKKSESTAKISKQGGGGQKPTESVLDIILRKGALGNAFSYTNAVNATPVSTGRRTAKKVNRK